MEEKKIFKTGLLFHHYANTAYPLTPTSFLDYKIQEVKTIPGFLKEELNKLEELSLYVHIPFCQQRCKFCEYAVLEDTTDDIENTYVDLLLKEMDMYAALLEGKKIVGYDLGGGTPTKLSKENLRRITDGITSKFQFEKDVEFSVETTPIIAAKELDKIEYLYELGYRRISMGIQTISERLLNELGREGTVSIYEEAIANIRKAGFERINVDLMYGFLHQSDEDFIHTLNYAMELNPEYITLYRNRYKGTKIESESGGVSLYKIIRQYRIAYQILNENGYIGNPGKNTFSRVKDNYGTSDYLTKRVINGTSYVGMGLGAQSFGLNYLAYNQGAATKQLGAYKEAIEEGRFPIQDIYSLPLEESIGKMVSVAFYFGFVKLSAFKERFGIDFITQFEKEVAYVLKEKLMELDGDYLRLTERGADYINGIIPLFYSKQSKQELLRLSNNKIKPSYGEEEFLSTYDMKKYERPSVTVDIVVFDKTRGQILFIRRGEHPYMNALALPGGFVKSDETVEEAAIRELQEETGIRAEVEQLELIGVYSKPNRDPRGWVISSAFLLVGEFSKQDVFFGDDAIEIQWKKYTSLDSEVLAFDHKEIVASALKRIREVERK